MGSRDYRHALKEAVIEETINYEMAKRIGLETGDEEDVQDAFAEIYFQIMEHITGKELTMSEYFIEYFGENGELASSLYEETDNMLVNAACARAIRETLRKTSDHYGVKTYLFDMFVNDYERDALEEIREQGGVTELLRNGYTPKRESYM